MHLFLYISFYKCIFVCTLPNVVLMMIAPNSRARKGGEEEYGRIWGEEDGNAYYGGMVQPIQHQISLKNILCRTIFCLWISDMRFFTKRKVVESLGEMSRYRTWNWRHLTRSWTVLFTFLVNSTIKNGYCVSDACCRVSG